MKPAVRIILSVVVLIVVAGGSFLGGTLFGRNQAQVSAASRRGTFFQGTAGQNGQGGLQVFRSGTPGAQGEGTQRGQGFGGGTFGTIEKIGDGEMVVTDQSGKQTTVKVSDTTLIEKQASVTLKDLAQGETVIVSGSTGQDGVVTARSVQVVPAGRFGPPGAAGTPPAPAQ